jgi:hypothetical protein
MVLAYWGMERNQQELAQMMNLHALIRKV